MRSTVQHDDSSYLGSRLDGRKRCSHAAGCNLYRARRRSGDDSEVS